jgi:hypothetical protein
MIILEANEEVQLTLIGKFAPFSSIHAAMIAGEISNIKSIYSAPEGQIVQVCVKALMTHSEQTMFNGSRIEFSDRIKTLTESMLRLSVELQFLPVISHTHSISEFAGSEILNFEHLTRNIRHGSIIITRDAPYPYCLRKKRQIKIN